MPLGPSSRSNALSSPPKGPLSSVLFGHLSANTSIIFITVSLFSASFLVSGERALFIGRVSQPWPVVWNIVFVGLIGCRWRLQKAGTRQLSMLSPLPPPCPVLDASGTRIPLADQTTRRRPAYHAS